jgi:thiamine-phosphate diphosphorylase
MDTGANARAAGRLPRLHLITDDDVLAREDWAEVVEAVLEEGRERVALHVRGPSSSGHILYMRAQALLGDERKGAALIVNDRVDIALALPVDGVQLRETSLPVDEARRLLGTGRWIGASVHEPGRARTAEAEGADYLLVGTLFATPSHPNRSGGGLGLLAEMLESSELPLVAIGGVTPDRARALREAGAYGVAVLSGVWGAPDPVAAVRDYLGAVKL